MRKKYDFSESTENPHSQQSYIIKEVVSSKITYLEMRSRPVSKNLVKPENTKIELIEKITTDFYRELYLGVGKNFNWCDRVLMKDEDLKRIIEDPLVKIHLLNLFNKPVGYIELDYRISNEVEIAYFGIFPKHQGLRFGSYLLNWGIQKAWESNPNRVWVHTCDLDHPLAIKTYINAGFVIYKEEVGTGKILEWY